jgi:hypothetical protein
MRRLMVLAAAAALAGCSAFLVRPVPTVTPGNFPACTEGPGAPLGDVLIATVAGLIAYDSIRTSGQVVVPAGVFAVYFASGIYGLYTVNACRNAQLDAVTTISPVPFRAPSIPLPPDGGADAQREGGAGG